MREASDETFSPADCLTDESVTGSQRDFAASLFMTNPVEYLQKEKEHPSRHKALVKVVSEETSKQASRSHSARFLTLVGSLLFPASS